MTITLNGKDHPLDTPMSVRALLLSIGLGEQPVVVELNQQALFPREYNEHTIKDGDRLEIISIAAGG